jgi:thiamine-phosphate pyrophosphorylase
LDSKKLIDARDTRSDVGTRIASDSEYKRSSVTDVVASNFSRLQQSLRTIEEFGKLLSPDFAREIERLRYTSYTIEKALQTTIESRCLLADAKICVLVDCPSGLEHFSLLVRQLIEAQVDVLQLREKNLSDRELLEAGKLLSDLTQNTPVRWVMNDRADLALATGADGVHLGQSDLPVAIARRIVGAGRLIGVSTHSIDQARQAVLEGANYIGVGPVFASATKQFDRLAGLELIRQVAAEIRLPAFAIGGITDKNVSQVVENGLNRIALQGFVTCSKDLRTAISSLRNSLT